MFNFTDTLATLTPEQKARLLDLFAARNTLPWEDVDIALDALHLVHQRKRRSAKGVYATLTTQGWKLALSLSENPS